MALIKGIGIAKFSGGGGGSLPPLVPFVTELTVNLVAGNNTIPHNITTDILYIDIKNVENRQEKFSDFRWNNTNIYIWSNESLNNITFVIEHKNS